MEKQLIKKIKDWKLIYVVIPAESIKVIYDLLFSDQVGYPKTGLEYFYFGVYYEQKKNYDLMELYYRQAIELSTPAAMLNLGVYYEKIVRDYVQAKKYYEMTVKLEYDFGINKLGLYYREVEKDDDQMKKYFLIAIELGNVSAMKNLALYYKEMKNYDLMKKYFLMAIELADTSAMSYLAHYYRWVEKNYDLMKKFYLMAIELGESSAMNNLGYYYQHVEKDDDQMIKYYLMAIEHGEIISMYNLALYYRDKSAYYLPLMKKYATLAIRAGNIVTLNWMTKYHSSQIPNQDSFDFGVEHSIKDLIIKNYHPHYIHSLLRVNQELLPETLIQQKTEYLQDLFLDLTQKNTWFHPVYCVRDVSRMIQAYLTA